MLLWTIQISIFSIIFILLVHHILLFFKNTLTVPKIKDLVNIPHQKYEDMIYTITKPKDDNTHIPDFSSSTDKVDLKSMKNELKNFFKNKLNESETTTEIETLDSSQNYSAY
jgi:hypothetical protein